MTNALILFIAYYYYYYYKHSLRGKEELQRLRRKLCFGKFFSGETLKFSPIMFPAKTHFWPGLATTLLYIITSCLSVTAMLLD